MELKPWGWRLGRLAIKIVSFSGWVLCLYREGPRVGDKTGKTLGTFAHHTQGAVGGKLGLHHHAITCCDHIASSRSVRHSENPRFDIMSCSFVSHVLCLPQEMTYVCVIFRNANNTTRRRQQLYVQYTRTVQAGPIRLSLPTRQTRQWITVSPLLTKASSWGPQCTP